jgi:hypothetical protein
MDTSLQSSCSSEVSYWASSRKGIHGLSRKNSSTLFAWSGVAGGRFIVFFSHSAYLRRTDLGVIKLSSKEMSTACDLTRLSELARRGRIFITAVAGTSPLSFQRSPASANLSGPSKIDVEQDAHPWTVPVCFQMEDLERRCEVVTGSHTELRLPRMPGWIFPNAYGSGYYKSSWLPRQK